jgi:hypothetical protein
MVRRARWYLPEGGRCNVPVQMSRRKFREPTVSFTSPQKTHRIRT